MMRLLAATAVLAASLGGAGAQELTCANSGNTYQVGDIACITACHQSQRRLARCERISYGTTWIYLSETCPSARMLDSLKQTAWCRSLDTGFTPLRVDAGTAQL